VRGVASAN